MIFSNDFNDDGPMKVVKLYKKCLREKVERIGPTKDIEKGLALSLKPVTVVGVIGKSVEQKNTLLNALLDRPAFGTSLDTTLDKDGSSYKSHLLSTIIEAYHDTSANILYLNLNSVLDKSNLIQFITTSDPESLDSMLSKEECLEMQCMLFLFLVSNIILVSTSTLSAEMEWVHIFKALGSMKRTLSMGLQEYLEAVFSQNRQSQELLKSQLCPGKTVPILAFVFNIYDYIRSKEKGFKIDTASVENQTKTFLKYIHRSSLSKNLFSLDQHQASFIVSLSHSQSTTLYQLVMGIQDEERPYGMKAIRMWIQNRSKANHQSPKKPNDTPMNNNSRNKKDRYVVKSENTLSSKAWFTVTEKVKYYLLEEKLDELLASIP